MVRMQIWSTRLLFWADGMAVTPWLVLTHPRARKDAGLLAHEAVHCRQMREVGMLRFWWLYFSCRPFRLWAEVEAYRVSLAHRPNGLRSFARSLAHGYLLGIREDEAERLLLGTR